MSLKLTTLAAVFASVAFSFAVGCSAADDSESTGEASSTNTATPQGVYEIKGNPDYTWVKMEDGKYGLWKSGDACNADPANADASACLETGTYEISDDGKAISLPTTRPVTWLTRTTT